MSKVFDLVSPSELLSINDRFVKKVKKEDCWVWLGYKLPAGYGQFYVKGKTVLAHRWAYFEKNGCFDYSLFVCHKCDNPSCVNPSHLFLCTNSDNMKDCGKKGRLACQIGKSHHSLKTHCKRGHKFSGSSTYIKNGVQYKRRRCWRCEKLRNEKNKKVNNE